MTPLADFFFGNENENGNRGEGTTGKGKEGLSATLGVSSPHSLPSATRLPGSPVARPLAAPQGPFSASHSHAHHPTFARGRSSGGG